jgi:hypothetical protein
MVDGVQTIEMCVSVARAKNHDEAFYSRFHVPSTVHRPPSTIPPHRVCESPRRLQYCLDHGATAVPIEFHCPHCDKYLKTNDDKAGMQVNCPGCAGPLTIPDAPAAEATPNERIFVSDVPHVAAVAPLQVARHRGELLLVFSLLGWFVCSIFAIVAWVMANQDLAAMDGGQMDTSGRGLTQAGKIISMIHLGLIAVAVVGFLLFIVCGVLVGVANA